MMLRTNRAVLIRYTRDGVPRRGSGLRVAGTFVLTADHCANGTCHVLVVDGAEYPATIYARGNSDTDLALLNAPTLPAVEPLTYAVMDREVPSEISGCWALGFPVWKDGSLGPRLAQVPGNVPTAEGVDPQAQSEVIPPMSLKITNPDIRDWTVVRGDLDQPGSPWAGMSGAAVVTSDDLIVGVLRAHSPAEGTGSLTATRLEAITNLPMDVTRRFLTALQASDPGNWPKIQQPAASPAALLDQEFTLSCDVDPLDGSGRADFGGDVGIVYLGGFKFQLSMGNASARPIVVRAMKIDVRSRDLVSLVQSIPERSYGQLLIAHQLFVDLHRDYYCGWWMLSDGERLSSAPRPISSTLKDVFESAGLARISFSLGPGESEFIEGAFVARDPGIYEVKISVLAVDASQTRTAKATNAIRLCYMEEASSE